MINRPLMELMAFARAGRVRIGVGSEEILGAGSGLESDIDKEDNRRHG